MMLITIMIKIRQLKLIISIKNNISLGNRFNHRNRCVTFAELGLNCV